MTAILELSHITAGVLDRCSLTVPAGSLTAVVGLVGSGRTTLAQVIMGERRPRRGRVSLDGVDVTDTSPVARARFGAGWARNPPRLFPSLTVEENVYVAASATKRWGAAEAARRAAELLERYGIAHLARVPAWQVGPADAARVEVVRVLSAPRRLIIVDELAALIPRAEVDDLAEAICATAQMGGAVVWFDAPAHLAVIPDQLAVLADGHVVVAGPPQEVENSPEWAALVGRDGSLPPGLHGAGAFAPGTRSPGGDSAGRPRHADGPGHGAGSGVG